MTGELCKHAVSEGTKSVSMFLRNGGGAPGEGRGMRGAPPACADAGQLSKLAGLQFPVAQTAAFATLMAGAQVEPSAAVYLAAVLE